LLTDKNVSLSFVTPTAEISKGGDLAYTQGTYSMTHTDPKSKKAVTEEGKYVTVHKKQTDGS
jgi:ketosteroid isomerase-like protein